jgi:hypothetical protein
MFLMQNTVLIELLSQKYSICMFNYAKDNHQLIMNYVHYFK